MKKILAALALHCVPLLAQAQTIDEGAWSGRCAAGEPCFIRAKTQGPSLLLGWLEKDRTMQLGVVLPAAVGTGKPVSVRTTGGVMMYLQTNFCGPEFCEAMLLASEVPRAIEHLKTERGGVIAYLDKNQIKLSTFSLEGFAQAYAKMRPAK